jgi:hypothetical protein
MWAGEEVFSRDAAFPAGPPPQGESQGEYRSVGGEPDPHGLIPFVSTSEALAALFHLNHFRGEGLSVTSGRRCPVNSRAPTRRGRTAARHGTAARSPGGRCSCGASRGWATPSSSCGSRRCWPTAAGGWWWSARPRWPRCSPPARGWRRWWPTTARRTHAHHIVMKAGFSSVAPTVRRTQAILPQVGIDPIFGYDTLVWAPNWGTHKTGTAPAPNHGAGYTGLGYAQAVYDQIRSTDGTKTAIEVKLRTIAQNFIQGVW